MRLVCPSCQAAYNVPEAKLGHTAHRLRCARCGHVWNFVPPPPAMPEPAPPRPNVPLPGVPSRAAEAERVKSITLPPHARLTPPPRRAIGPLVAWVLSVALLAGLGVAAWHWRHPIMAAWPPSERVYRLLDAG